MTSRKEGRTLRIMATVISVVVNITFVLWLMGLMNAAAPLQAPAGVTTLELLWVQELSPAQEQLPKRLAVRQERPGAPVASTRQRAVGADRNAPTPSPVPTRPRETLDLSLPQGYGDEPIKFVRALNARPRQWPERESYLQVDFEDRSLGGRLHRMGKASICAELRRAVQDARRHGDGGGVDLIAAQMRERGCR